MSSSELNPPNGAVLPCMKPRLLVAVEDTNGHPVYDRQVWVAGGNDVQERTARRRSGKAVANFGQVDSGGYQAWVTGDRATLSRWLVWDGYSTSRGNCTRSLPAASHPPPVAEHLGLRDLQVAANDHTLANPNATLVVPALRVRTVETSRTFAPCVDYMSIRVELEHGHHARTLLLRIRDRDHHPVYEEVLDEDRLKTLHADDPWPANKPRSHPATPNTPSEIERLARPDRAPYTASVWVATDPEAFSRCRWDGQAADFPAVPGPEQRSGIAADESAGAAAIGVNQSAVVFGGLKLTFGEWLPKQVRDDVTAHVTGLAPAGAADLGADARVRHFVRYKLNALGVFAGTVSDEPADDDLKRATARYKQSHRELYERVFVRSADPNTVDYEYKPNHRDALERITGDFVAHLLAQGADQNRYRTRVMDPVVIGDPMQVKELYVDADRYFLSQFDEFKTEAPNATETRKSLADAAWLTRPAIPIRASATYRTRDNRDTPAGAPFGVKWDWKDVTWDRTAQWAAIPDFTAARPNLTRSYLAAAETKCAQTLGAANHAGGAAPHNCPAIAGGLVTASATDNRQRLFSRWGGTADPCRFTARAADGAIVTTAWMGADDQGPRRAAEVFFRTSHIAGDAYQVVAEYDLDQVTADLHTDLLGAHQPASTESGRIEIWRRVKIAAYVTWAAAINPPVNWNEVRSRFSSSYIAVEGPVVTRTIDQLNIAADFQADMDQMVDKEDVNYVTAWRWRSPPPPAGAPAPPNPAFTTSAVFPAEDPWTRYDHVRLINDVVFHVLAPYCRGKPATDPNLLGEFQWLVQQWGLLNGSPEKVFIAGAAAYFLPLIGQLIAAPGRQHFPPYFPPGYAPRAAARTLDQITDEAADYLNLLFRIPAIEAAPGGALHAYAAPHTNDLDRVKGLMDVYNKISDRHHGCLLGGLAHAINGINQHNRRAGSIKPAVPWGPLTGADIRTRMATDRDREILVRTVEVTSVFSTNYQNQLSSSIDRAVRAIIPAQCASGMILLHFDPVDPARFDGQVQSQSQATVNGVVFLDAGMTRAGPAAVNLTFLVAHELAHALFLHHWKNAGDQADEDHDQYDQNCILSYSSAKPNCPRHYSRSGYDPRFCGKCVLKLRGWNIRADAARLLPIHTPNPAQTGKPPCGHCGSPSRATVSCEFTPIHKAATTAPSADGTETIIKLKDAAGADVAGPVVCRLVQGAATEEEPVNAGQAVFRNLAPGDWEVSFPEFDANAWEKQ